LLIPGKEAGLRRFCLWAIGLAVLTLRKIAETPGFTSGKQVKVPRSAVAVTRITTNLSVRNNWMLERLFNLAARGVPLAPPGTVPRPTRPALLTAAAPTPEYPSEYPLGAARPVQIDRGARRSEGRSAL
jgi:farnesyl-diphosphate farnesyltransferase